MQMHEQATLLCCEGAPMQVPTALQVAGAEGKGQTEAVRAGLREKRSQGRACLQARKEP